MHVDQAQPGARQAVPVGENEDLIILGSRRGRQGLKKAQDLRSVTDASAGQFAHDEGMAKDFPGAQETGQDGVASPQVIHPDGRVGQDHVIQSGGEESA